jgi:hypothetical protein
VERRISSVNEREVQRRRRKEAQGNIRGKEAWEISKEVSCDDGAGKRPARGVLFKNSVVPCLLRYYSQ